MFLKSILVLIFSCLIGGNVFAQNVGEIKSNEPIEITSNQLRIFKKTDQAIFEGNVLAIQGDLKLYCDKMTVFFEKKNPSQEQQDDAQLEKSKINKIDFEGNVFIITPQESASSHKGDYNVPTGIFTLVGDVEMIQNKNTLKGHKMIYNKNTGESLLTNKSNSIVKKQDRVKAILIPEDKSGKETGN